MNTTQNETAILLIEKKAPQNSALNILVIGVFHGDEHEGEYIINRYLQETRFNDNTNSMYFIPCLNPYGLKKGTRGNENGVDLNRNFPTKNWEQGEKDDYYSGTGPASENETQYMVAVIEKVKPDAILTIHAPFKIVNFDGPAKELAQKISKLSGYPIQADIGYPTPGSFGTYCGVERNIPTITLELDEEDTLENLYNKVEPVITYLAYHYKA